MSHFHRPFLCLLICLSTSQCKQRTNSSLYDSESVESASDFVIKISARIDELFYGKAERKDRCYDPKNQSSINYIDPFGGVNKIAIGYSPCLKFYLDKVKKIGDKEISYASATLRGSEVRALAKKLYCRQEGNKKVYLDCVDKRQALQIDAAVGYFLHAALEFKNTVAALEKYDEVRQVQPLLLEREYLGKSPFLEIQAQINDKYGKGNDRFAAPVLAMLSGMASTAMYDQTRDTTSKAFQEASDAIESIFARQLAVKLGFVQNTTAEKIVDMPNRCYRKASYQNVKDSCLGFPCDATESKTFKIKFNSDYLACNPSIVGSLVRTLGGFTLLGLVIPGTIGMPNYLQEDALNLAFKVIDDGTKRFAFEVDDYVLIDRYLTAYGLQERFAK